jgi:hypothetical protein
MTAAHEGVRAALHDIWRAARATNSNPCWGQRRFAGRAAEFGLTTDYELAEVLVDIAIENRKGEPGRDSVSLIGRDSVILNRIAEVACQPVGKSHFDLNDDVLARLASDAATDAIAWDACARIAEDAIERGQPIPTALGTWSVKAMGRETTRPDGRAAGYLVLRDDLVRFAIRLAMESGAFKAATHSGKAQRPGVELRNSKARSACELVAFRMSKAKIGVAFDYESAAKIWKGRDRNLDCPTVGNESI